MGQSAGHITRSFNNADVDSLLVEKTGDLGTLVVSGKINKRSRYKPYAFGSYDTLLVDQNGKENPILKENNFGMRPATFGWNPYRALPWDQYTPPKPEAGKANLRFTDMDHYYQFAAGGISTARIYTNNPNEDRKVMLGGNSEGQEGRIIGEIVYSFNPKTEILPEDFFNPKITRHSLADYRFTLLFGPIQNGETSFNGAP